jgi:predicted phage baseplate assembly protein
VRFGDGEFGRLPAPSSLFEVEYRLGSGTSANVPAGAVSSLDIQVEVSDLAGRVVSASNPFPVTSGVDAESAEEIKLLTPEAYKSETFFAVRPEDYGAQAEKLNFVQKAQGSFRWTGSWLSVMTAVDPVDAFELSADRRAQVEALLNCRRQAGRDVIVKDPKFVNLDLIIRICVSRDAFPGHVRIGVLEALFGKPGFRSKSGFFDPDNFTFGTPLHRSALEAAIVAVPGVEAVTGIEIRTHGVTEFHDFEAMTREVADDELIRVENSPLRPERGSVILVLEGGA